MKPPRTTSPARPAHPEDEDDADLPVRYPEAMEALVRGDLDAAQAAYTEALDRQPGDPEAKHPVAPPTRRRSWARKSDTATKSRYQTMSGAMPRS